ncbi:GNAT family N-acetyltransferase [Fictibacillus sp. KU28468]|uniref:GNAT family N-acetyltransferase n=1 Tax=Fictibacillus sp. KU28468 TaxID=2991053 RepID=UPI00223D562C|nr:GNAT family N-acetyltransferase [Fictibacillus sp. KU28468]UZJ77821.1 GNAT family N-acetyltransferase [Fictibacillus sp. KU28468]
MKLETERLTIIPCSRPYIESLSPDAYPIRNQIKSHVEQLEQDPELYGWGVWLVTEKETGMIVGDIGFKGKPSAERTVEVGYGIIPSAQKKGYATESVRAIIDWAFSSDQVNRVIAECLINNDPSIRVLEKMNMKRLGQEGEMLNWELKKEEAGLTKNTGAFS